MRSVCDQRSSSRELSIELTTEIIPIFAMVLAMTIYVGPVVALERPLPLLSVQRFSTTFNTVQHHSTPEGLAVLKRVEHLPAVTFRTSLEGRSTRGVGGSRSVLSEA